MGLFSWLFRKKNKKVKIGLALGSGGAKGFAHLGVLRAFEDNGINIDMVAGASIGSIVGAFYCNGYSSVDIIELLSMVDYSQITTNPIMIKMNSSGLFKVVDREIGSLEIQELKKPFRAVATNLDTGKEKVFDSGSVAKALCASSSMLPFFKPVVIDGEKYVDGGYTNAIPADVVKSLGADYVIGVDLSTSDSKLGLIKKILPSYKSDVKDPLKKGYENSDIIIHPDLNEYTSLSFGSGNRIYDLGYQQAVKVIPRIKKDIENLQNKKKKSRA